MTQNKKNVMVLIVLAALALVCGALLYLDPTGMRSCTTGQLEREFASRARQFLGDQGKITILQESNDDVIVFFCCNASRTSGLIQIHEKASLSLPNRWERSSRETQITRDDGIEHTESFPRADNTYGSVYVSLGDRDIEPTLRLE